MQAPDVELIMDTFRLLIRTSRRLRRLVQPILARWELTGAQFGTLSRIPKEGISLTELAQRSSADLATVSGIVDRLVKSGLVERKRSETDRRAVVITLTRRGEEVVDAITPLHQEAVCRVLGRMEPGRLSQLNELLQSINALLDTASGEAVGDAAEAGAPRDARDAASLQA